MANNFRHYPSLMARCGVPPTHILHVGAHQGEEMPYYAEAGFRKITLVEPNPRLAHNLAEKYPYVDVVKAACGHQAGRGRLSIMARTNLSTLVYPQPEDKVVGVVDVPVLTVDALVASSVAAGRAAPNCLVVDVQGHETAVLEGAVSTLPVLDLVTVETCTVPDTTMAASYSDVRAFMLARGFDIAEEWTRDYQWLHKWARRKSTTKKGSVIDVTFLRRLPNG